MASTQEGGHIGEGGRTGGSGGGQSFQQLYNQSFGRLYDFALRVLRDREEAALAVQASYLAVYQELQAGDAYPSFEVQLFAASHRDISDRLRRRRGPQPEGTQEAFDTPDPLWAADPAVANDASELARTAWQVASAARPEELEPLDLQVRQGFNDEEIAAVLRTRPETVRQRLVRLQQGLEDSFSALLLTHRGRRACVDLDFLVGEEPWSMSVRRRALKHLQTCQICRRTRMSYPPAANVYAALQPVEAPRGWKEAMLARLEELAGGTFAPIAAMAMTSPQPRPAPPPPPQTTQRTGAAVLPPPGPIEPPTTYGSGGGFGTWFGGLFTSGDARGPLLAMLLGAMLVVVIVLAALCSAGAFDSGGGGSKGTTTPTVTGTKTGSATPTRTLTPTRTPTLPPVPSTATPVPTQPPVVPTNTPVPPPPPPTNTSAPPPPENTSPPVVTPPP